MSHDRDDDAFLERINAREPEALHEFLKKLKDDGTGNQMRGYIARCGFLESDLDEVFWDAIERAWGSEGEPVRNARAWLWGFIRVAVVDAIRARKRRKDKPFSAIEDTDSERERPYDVEDPRGASAEPHPDEKERRQQLISEALNTLSDAEKMVYVLYENHEPQEIAEIMNLPRGRQHVYELYRSAMKKLEKYLRGKEKGQDTE